MIQVQVPIQTRPVSVPCQWNSHSGPTPFSSLKPQITSLCLYVRPPFLVIYIVTVVQLPILPTYQISALPKIPLNPLFYIFKNKLQNKVKAKISLILIRGPDMWMTGVMCLGPCSLNSWWNTTQFLCKALVCRSSRTRVGNLQKFRTILYTKV